MEVAAQGCVFRAHPGPIEIVVIDCSDDIYNQLLLL